MTLWVIVVILAALARCPFFPPLATVIATCRVVTTQTLTSALSAGADHASLQAIGPAGSSQ